MARTIGAKDIWSVTRVAVVVFLSKLSKEGRLHYGTITRTKRTFGLCRKAVEAIWGLRDDVATLVQTRRSYPLRLSPEEVQCVAAVQPCQCQKLRALEAATGISRSTLHRHLMAKALRRFISRIKPLLTD
jgi:hypothetical protein